MCYSPPRRHRQAADGSSSRVALTPRSRYVHAAAPKPGSHGRPDRHHREDQPGAGRPRGHRLPVRSHSACGGPSAGPDGARTGRARLEAMGADPAATRGLYATKPAQGGGKAAKLSAIREALRSARRVWLATDCDREGQLIGQEILEHCHYRGQVMRVLFTAQDARTIRDAFERAKTQRRIRPISTRRRSRAGRPIRYTICRSPARRLSHWARGARAVIGVGRVKTPTLGIVCQRERWRFALSSPKPIFEVDRQSPRSPSGRLFDAPYAPTRTHPETRTRAGEWPRPREGFEGRAQAVRVEDKRQSPPRLHDLPSLQKLCGSRFGWSASEDA